MGQTGYGFVGRKYKGYRYNTEDKTASKGSEIDTDLIEYIPKTLVNKEAMKRFKHVDPVVNINHPLPLAGTKAISNTHNNPRSSVDCYKNN